MPSGTSLARALRGMPYTGLPPGPVGLAVAAAVVVLLATGVRPWEIAAFAGYQAVFVLAPGLLVLRAVVARRGAPVTQLAIGWPLGHALEIAAFWVTAYVGVRWLLYAYPPVVCALALGLASRRSAGRRAPSRAVPGVPRAPAWATAAIVAGAAALIGLGAFAANPLPRSVPSVVLDTDSVFHVALAAEARHHWPMTDPNVSGEKLRYHVFVHMEAAAVNQVTGIGLDVIVLRLQPVLIVLLIGLQLAWLAGRVARGSPWVAPGAVAIMLLANELDLDTERDAPFVGLFLADIPLSPTLAFGLPFFIAAVGILVSALARRERPEPGTWLVLGALLAGAMGAKAATLPVLLVALGLFLAGRALLDRTVDRRALGALGIAAGAFLAVYLALFSGGGSHGGSLDPFAFLDYAVLAGELPFRGPVVALLGDAARTAALLAPWLGGLLLIGRVRGRDRTVALWLAAVAAGAFAPFALIAYPALAQGHFLGYGMPAAAVLSAWGIARWWPAARSRAVTLAAVGAALATAVVVAAVLRERVPEDVAPTIGGYLGPYAVLMAALAIVAIAVARPRRTALAWLIALVAATALLDKPLDVIPGWVESQRAGEPHYDVDGSRGQRGVDARLLAGLRWLRDHSSPRDVIATDVHTTSAAGRRARYFYPAAYAERRTFLGGWDYTLEVVTRDVPFRERRALSHRAYRGERRALSLLRRRYGVRFLLVDLRHAGPKPALDRRLPRVYADPALRIYRLQ